MEDSSNKVSPSKTLHRKINPVIFYEIDYDSVEEFYKRL